jgi:hypothetical protein
VIDELLERASDPGAEPDLRELVAGHVRALRNTARGDDGGLVKRAEEAVRVNPSGAVGFDSSGLATLSVGADSWCAGRFEIPSISDLRGRVSASGGSARLWVFDGVSPATDIGALQATGGGSPLFQVASQFNCLESPGPRIVPVANYFSDPTQGPRASISAFPATLQRHYMAGSDGSRFVQRTDGPQIDLLADVFAPGTSPVRSGYLADDGGLGGEAVATALEERFDRIRIGIHDEAAVVLGYDWYGAVANNGGRRITQCFTSTVAGGGYGGQRALGASFEPACRQLLRAAYLGTLLAAIAHDRSPAVLTLVGGGAFANPHNLIWESIIWAFDHAQAHAIGTLDVIVNGRTLGHELPPKTILADVRDRGGAVLRFDTHGLTHIDR